MARDQIPASLGRLYTDSERLNVDKRKKELDILGASSFL